jgi:hypothetical protein
LPHNAGARCLALGPLIGEATKWLVQKCARVRIRSWYSTLSIVNHVGPTYRSGEHPIVGVLMQRSTIILAVIAAVGFVVANQTLPLPPLQVISSDANARFLEIGINKAVAIDLPRDIQEVLVAVNPTDVMARNGARAEQQKADPPPYVPGMEAAGIVDEVGSGVPDRLKPGDAVMAIVVPQGSQGAYLEQIVLDARSVVRAPTGKTHPEAATLPMNGLTARLSLDLLKLSPGQVIAVTGAAGAYGGYVIQLAKAEGLTVIALSGVRRSRLVLPEAILFQLLVRAAGWSVRVAPLSLDAGSKLRAVRRGGDAEPGPIGRGRPILQVAPCRLM